MALLIENNAYSRLAASLAAAGTSLTVETGTGDRFPIAIAPNYFKLTLQDAANNIEIIKVTARAASSDSLTIERAQEGTTARAWNIGDIVELRLTAGVTAPLQVLEEADTAALIRGKIDVPTRTGGDATGTWGISITGNAASVTNGVYTIGNQTINGIKTFSELTATGQLNFSAGVTGFIEFVNRSAGSLGYKWYVGANGSANVMSLNTGGDLNVSGLMTAAQFNGSAAGLTGTAPISITGNAASATELQTARTINGVSFNGTANITITANTPNNITFNNGGAGGGSGSAFNGGAALTVSYNTVGAPSTTGANASGTWAINISGNAATATNATQLGGLGSTRTMQKRRVDIQSPASMDTAITAPEMGFVYTSGGSPVSGPFMAFGGLGGDIDYSCQMVAAYNGGGNALYFRTRNDDTTVWNPWRNVLHDGNYNSYSPTLTGGGASGTWGINITGNATTATTLQTARTINGVSFNGSANISVNLNNSLTAGDGLTGTTFNGGAASTFALGTPSTISNTSTDSVTATSHTHALIGELVETTAGSPAYYGARAFVNFNGTGTVAIRNSQNVSSITDNAVGAYTVNLTTAMPDANYTVNGNAGDLNSSATVVSLFRDEIGNLVAPTVSAFRIITSFDMGAGQRLDNEHVCVSVFR